MKTLKNFFGETLIFVFLGPLIMLLAIGLFAVILSIFALFIIAFLPLLVCVLWSFVGLIVLKKYFGVKTFDEVAQIAELLLNSSEDEENS